MIDTVKSTFESHLFSIKLKTNFSISAIIGVFWAWRDRNKSTEEYMLGGGNVNFIPISMSLATTFFSAIAVLGIPAEFYIYGTMYTYFLAPYLICTILSAEVFGPIYMDMGVTSTYEYLEVSFLNFMRILPKFRLDFINQ